eukprot:CAMPEP_0198155992 /NCGR_PEP_ID=MMETSP1443-20131203/69425_1 /TAXON_ID=186043 /ORGANISM="Entomoneis sp., Strain CCMP2396" /LENGTH=370 /DNA_ID=CAMNT_0043822767 /DNA_START=445 /DNA_END=1557 /DNA_ORIENTATION=+
MTMTEAPTSTLRTTTSSLSDGTKSRNRIRIRQTVESDLAAVAAMLSTAAYNDNSSSPSLSNPFDWKNQLDQMLARADIGVLLKCRLEALEEGRKAWDRVNVIIPPSNDRNHEEEKEDSEDNEDEDDIATNKRDDANNRLKLMWATSGKLRDRIAKASADTGEDNLWRRHNFALTPQDISWFNHLQMTAEDVHTGQVVGFCEVAMLSNPVLEQRLLDEDDQQQQPAFSPAITNLVTAPECRRKGIATRMLKLAERIVRDKWQSKQKQQSDDDNDSTERHQPFGLYVEKTNDAAIALYSRLGYEKTVTCNGGDRLGELWYMVQRRRSATNSNAKRRMDDNEDDVDDDDNDSNDDNIVDVNNASGTIATTTPL